MNEFLYQQLKDSGLTSRVSEEIGIEFTELYKSSNRSSLVNSLISYGSAEFDDHANEEEKSSDQNSERSEALLRVKEEFYISCDTETQQNELNFTTRSSKWNN